MFCVSGTTAIVKGAGAARSPGPAQASASAASATSARRAGAPRSASVQSRVSVVTGMPRGDGGVASAARPSEVCEEARRCALDRRPVRRGDDPVEQRRVQRAAERAAEPEAREEARAAAPVVAAQGLALGRAAGEHVGDRAGREDGGVHPLRDALAGGGMREATGLARDEPAGAREAPRPIAVHDREAAPRPELPRAREAIAVVAVEETPEELARVLRVLVVVVGDADVD